MEQLECTINVTWLETKEVWKTHEAGINRGRAGSKGSDQLFPRQKSRKKQRRGKKRTAMPWTQNTTWRFTLRPTPCMLQYWNTNIWMIRALQGLRRRKWKKKAHSILEAVDQPKRALETHFARTKPRKNWNGNKGIMNEEIAKETSQTPPCQRKWLGKTRTKALYMIWSWVRPTVDSWPSIISSGAEPAFMYFTKVMPRGRPPYW